MLYPDRPTSHENHLVDDLATVRYECAKNVDYAEFVRRHWRDHQAEADRQRNAITQKVMRQKRSA